jgi:4'-phosphopantetheinyl transferase
MGHPQPVTAEPTFLSGFEARAPLTFSSMPEMSVHLFSVEKCLGNLEALSVLLAPEERARATEITHTNRRNAYVASRGLLRAALTDASRGVVPADAWAFGTGPFGKPHVTAPEAMAMRFSLSYTATLIAIAVSSRYELGVDVEAVPGTVSEVPWQVLTQAERQFIRTLPADQQFAEFLNIWTMKEAYTKYLGVGASLDFRKVEVRTGKDSEAARSPAETRLPDPTVKLRTIEVGWQRIVVAVAGAKPIEGNFAAPAGEAVTLLKRV